MNKKIGKKLFGLICIFIILVSSWGGFLGQAIAFKTTVVWDRENAQHEISIPEAGDAIKVPEEVDQSGATCESMQNNFTAGTQKKLKEEWIRQGELSEDGWAYLEIDGEKRYLVALTPVFGLPGDYVDIYLTYNGEDKVYPCMIFDAKDTWVDDAYIYDGIAYGHLAGRNSEQCNIIEIITPNAIGDYEGLSAMMATLTGVTQIANGGSWLENPDGPTGLEGPYNYLDGSSGAGNDDSSVGGIIGGWLRDFWDYLAVLFENSVNDEDNVTTLYDIKNLNDNTNSSSSSSEGGYEIDVDGFVHYYQSDYAYVPYCELTLAERGCGPTAFAMVASTILGRNITPEDAVTWCNGAYGVNRSWNILGILFSSQATFWITRNINDNGRYKSGSISTEIRSFSDFLTRTRIIYYIWTLYCTCLYR